MIIVVACGGGKGSTPIQIRRRIASINGTRIPLPRVNNLLREKRSISPEMAVLLSAYFGTPDGAVLPLDYTRGGKVVLLNRGSHMDYEKYRCNVVEEDHTLLGKLGIEESTVASMKKGLKTVAGLATSAVATIANTGKVLAPGVAHATSLVAGAGLASRDTAAAASTAYHIDGLKGIQSDLTNNRVTCSCKNCLEVVGYAISQKTMKLARKTAAVISTAVDTLSPVPMHLGLVMRGGSVAHTVDKQLSGTRGVERSRQAELLYDGARGVRWHAEDGSSTFQNYCVVARALVDELTSGHWKRWVSCKGGQEEVFRRLSSKNM